jgi:hypothetical protein
MHPPSCICLTRAIQAHDPRAGLCAWDEAFLKALYRTSLSLITQRSVITGKMLHGLSP